MQASENIVKVRCLIFEKYLEDLERGKYKESYMYM